MVENDLLEAVDAVKSGGVIAFPTDTFYALGVDALNEAAIRRAFEVKQRPATVPMPVLISDYEQIERFAVSLDRSTAALAASFWPGALTIVVDANDAVPSVLTGGLGTVGLRMPDHDLARTLISQIGYGVTGTSANISQQEPSKDWRIVQNTIGDKLQAIVPGTCGNASSASTVVRVADDSIQILRAGPISADEIHRVLKTNK